MPESILIRAQDVDEGDALVLRSKFMEALLDPDLRECVHHLDIRRAQVDTNWCRRFLAHCDLDMDKALDFMLESVKFRHSMAVNELCGDGVCRQFFDIGAVWSHGHDRSGARLFIFNARLHFKQSGDMYEQGKRFLVFWIEKMEREEKGRRITIVFDMAQAGFANIDIGFIQYLINLFKLYYPDMLQNILVFEMPLLFTATWGVVKNMLPAKSHQLIKFVTRKDIGQHVPEQWLLERWGGADRWQYEVTDSVLHIPESPFLSAESGSEQEGTDSTASRQSHTLTNGTHLDSGLHINGKHTDSGAHTNGRHADNGPHINGKHKVHFGVESSSSESEAVGDAASIRNSTKIADLVEVVPADEIVFIAEQSEASASLHLKNISSASLAFKVKTTSPDRYRVRPSGGVLSASCTQRVQITLSDSARHLPNVTADRFLLQLVPLPEQMQQPASNQLTTLWKVKQTLPAGGLHELRFRCSARPSVPVAPLSSEPSLPEAVQRLSEVIARLERSSVRVEANQRRQLMVGWSLLLLFLLHVFSLLFYRPC